MKYSSVIILSEKVLFLRHEQLDERPHDLNIDTIVVDRLLSSHSVSGNYLTKVLQLKTFADQYYSVNSLYCLSGWSHMFEKDALNWRSAAGNPVRLV